MAHEQQQGTGLERFAQGLGKASISFLTETPQIELDRQAAGIALIETQAQDIQQQVEGARVDAQDQLQLQNLSRIAFGDGPDADAALAEIFARDSTLGKKILEGLGAISEDQRQEAARDAASIQSLPFEQRRSAILERAARVESQVDQDGNRRDASKTLSLLDMDEETQNNQLRIIQAAALTAAQRATGARGAGASKLGQSVVTTDPEGNLAFATPVLGPGGEVTTQTTPIGGQIVSRSAGETSAQRQLRDIQTAGGQTTARAVSARDQNFIDVGQRQADGTAIIRRGLQLLKTIKTGRPEAIALAASNLFGIAGADETELNANLGKAVLSQLRTTFGAQFTAQEGESLKELEANFGKSTAGNTRLLEQTLRSMERDARRGVDAALRNKDQFSIDEIEKALEFSLDPAATETQEFDFDPATGQLVPRQ